MTLSATHLPPRNRELPHTCTTARVSAVHCGGGVHLLERESGTYPMPTASNSFADRYLGRAWTVLDSAYLWVTLILLVPFIFIDMHLPKRWKTKRRLDNAS